MSCIIRKLEEIKERDARDFGIPWSGPQAEIAQELVDDRHFLLDLVDKLQESVAGLAIEIATNDRSWAQQVNEVAGMNYAAGAHDGALEAWDARGEY